MTKLALALTVNGALRCMVRPSASLLEVLREQFGLTAAKPGCGQGACGACTVLVDGRRINACLALALSQIIQGSLLVAMESRGLEAILGAICEVQA